MSVRTVRTRRRRKSPAERLRPFWILIALVLVLAAAGGYGFATWSGFYPQRIDITGLRAVTRADVLAKAGIAPDRNLWMQNTRAIAARIEALPYIETAAVHRRPLANLQIEVTERVPFAVLQSQGNAVLVDHALRVLQADDDASSLPRLIVAKPLDLQPGTFVHDTTVRALRDDDDALAAAHVVAVSLSQDRYGELVATMPGTGIRILLGDDDDLQKKIPLINPILAQLERAGRPIAAIDLRAPGTPVVVYRTR